MSIPHTIFPRSVGRDAAGGLTIAGHAVHALAEQYGTPLYLYDAATLREQARSLQALLQAHYKGTFEVTYAAKAYFSVGFARHLASFGLGVDVVSLGELTVARMAGFAPERVHLHGNNKSQAELAAALAWGIQSIVIDSLDELEIVEEMAQQQHRKVRVWLRISPGVTVQTHAYLQTSHHTSKFGITSADGQAEQAIRRALASPHLDLVGLHTHLGSQFFDAEPYREAIMRLTALAEACDFVPRAISPGGGWGVPYVSGQADGDPRDWIETVTRAVQSEFERRAWPLPHLIVEPGRWMAARAGVAVYSVGTIKTAGDGTRFVAVDGGMADNPRPALYQAPYSACLVDDPDAPPTQKVTLVGKFCESGDQLVADLPLPATRRGDLIAMPAAGAYQLSMASNYNLAPRPAVLWLEAERVDVLQAREELSTGWWMSGAA